MTVTGCPTIPAALVAGENITFNSDGAPAARDHCELCGDLTRVEDLTDDVCPPCWPEIFGLPAEVKR